MMHELSCTIVAMVVICGLHTQVARPSETPGQDQPTQENGSTAEPRNTNPAAFQVPAMWEYSAPLIAPEKRDHDPSRAQKDPTVVLRRQKWHVFMTVKLPSRSAIEYCSFESWDDADSSPRTILKVSDSDYYCAPQVFYFSPHKKWYLVYQMGVPGADKMWVAYSTTTDIADPRSWTTSQADPGRRGAGPTHSRRARLLDHL